MKYLFVTLVLLAALSCKKGFFLMQDADFQYHSAPTGQYAHTLKQFPEGIYLVRICSYDRTVDGQLIAAYRSCPDANLEADSLDKTAFFVFLDHQRVLYYSNDALWSSTRRTQHTNDVSKIELKLDQTTNRQKKVLRGYYQIESLSGDTNNLRVKMHLEKLDSNQVFINLRLSQDVLSVTNVGYADRANFKEGSVPPMVAWESVFDTPLEFYFYKKEKPSLFVGGQKISGIQSLGTERRYMMAADSGKITAEKTGQLSTW